MLRRSASSAEACCLTTAAIRPVSTCRPSSSSAVWDAAVDRVPRQGGQRGPLGVPAAVGSLVHGGRRGEVQLGAEAGRGQGGATDQHRQHRVGLLRHRRGAAAPLDGGLGQLGDLGPREQQHVVGDVAHRVGGADQRVGVPRERGAAGVPRVRRCRGAASAAVSATRNSAASASPASSTTAASVPAAPPTCTREAQRAQVVARVEHALEPLGGLEAEGDRVRRAGSACGRPSGRRGAARRARTERATCRSRSRQHRRGRVARAEHQRGVEHVLAGQPTVQPAGGVLVACGEALAQQGDQRYDGVAARPRRRAASSARSRARPARAGRCGAGRGDAGPLERVQPGLLDLDHGSRGSDALVEHQLGPARRRARRGRPSGARELEEDGLVRRPGGGRRSGSRARPRRRPGGPPVLGHATAGTGQRPGRPRRRAGRRG